MGLRSFYNFLLINTGCSVVPISQFFIVKYLKNRFFFVYFKKILKCIKSYRCNKPNFQHDNPLRHDSIHLRFCRKNWSLFHHSSRKMKRRNTPLHLYLLQSLGCRSTSKSRHFHRNQLRRQETTKSREAQTQVWTRSSRWCCRGLLLRSKKAMIHLFLHRYS